MNWRSPSIVQCCLALSACTATHIRSNLQRRQCTHHCHAGGTHHSFVWYPMSLPFLFVVCLNPSGLPLAYVYLAVAQCLCMQRVCELAAVDHQHRLCLTLLQLAGHLLQHRAASPSSNTADVAKDTSAPVSSAERPALCSRRHSAADRARHMPPSPGCVNVNADEVNGALQVRLLLLSECGQVLPD